MPTTQEVEIAKQNFIALKVFFVAIYNEGLIKINTVFQELNKVDNVTFNYQPVLNMYTNALYSVNDYSSNYLAAAIAGYNKLRPEYLNGKDFASIRECYDAVYTQAIIHLDDYINKTELYWYNTCSGNVYTPDDFYTLTIELNEVTKSNFITESNSNYNNVLTTAVQKLEDSLRYSLQ